MARKAKQSTARVNERTNPNDSPYSFANLYLFLFKSASLLYAPSEMTHFICVDFCQPSHFTQSLVGLVHPICFRILHPQRNALTKANQCCFGREMKEDRRRWQGKERELCKEEL
ncbi:hypothetical protein WR25_13085 [Diploscapter pachys]|uniref:Uncharacterized protein n=1 Tax=Diploscapter pachys TaxID=2018661 RepID=A0A2A2KF76_9BILA|nr:hypothetical protein WR25_13085 [Diploscapter pachys]